MVEGRRGAPERGAGPGHRSGDPPPWVASLSGADRRYGRFMAPGAGDRPSGSRPAGPSPDDRRSHPGSLPRVSARRWSGAGPGGPLLHQAGAGGSERGRRRWMVWGLDLALGEPSRRVTASLGVVPRDRAPSRAVTLGAAPVEARPARSRIRSLQPFRNTKPPAMGRPTRPGTQGVPCPVGGEAGAPPPRPLTARGTVPLADRRLFACARRTRSSRCSCANWSARLSRSGSLRATDLRFRGARASTLGGARGVPCTVGGSQRGFCSIAFEVLDTRYGGGFRHISIYAPEPPRDSTNRACSHRGSSASA